MEIRTDRIRGRACPRGAGGEQANAQPKIEARKSAVLTKSGLTLRDLNKNGVLDPYEDWRLRTSGRSRRPARRRWSS